MSRAAWKVDPGKFIPNLTAGLIIGIVTVTSCVSYGAFVFSQDLSGYLSFGIASALIGTALITAAVGLGSSFPLAMAGPGANTSAILALMVLSIATGIHPSHPAARFLPTVFAAICVSALFTGGLLLALGRFRLGSVIRFIPYPVAGGFLAGTGWLITEGGLEVTLGKALNLHQLPLFLQLDPLLHWLPAALFALLLLVVRRRSAHYLIMPLLLVAGMVLTHLALLLAGISLPQASARAWLFAPFPKGEAWEAWRAFSFAGVEWSVLWKQSGNMIALTALVTITILLNATGIELAAQTDVDLDRELRVEGIGNLLAGLCGGMVGCLMISRSLLNQRAGANSRLVGSVVAALCVVVLWWGTPVLVYIPRLVVGGLLLYLGLTLLVEWVYDGWFKLSRLDYALVLLILLVIATKGFLMGVGIGVVIACLLFVVSYSRIQVVRYALTGAKHRSNVERGLYQVKRLNEEGEQIHIVCLQGYIFFGTAYTLVDQVRRCLGTPGSTKVRFLLLDFRLVSDLDSSAVFGFLKLKQLASMFRLTLVLAGLKPELEERFHHGGFWQRTDEARHIFPDLDHGLEWCENQVLASGHPDTAPCDSLGTQLAERLPGAETIPRLTEYLEKLEVPSGEVLFRRDDPSDTLYFLESGQVSAVLEMEGGRKRRLRTMSPGTVFGEMGFCRGIPRSASVVADLPSRLYCLTRSAMKKMEDEDPQVARALQNLIIRLLADRLDHTTHEIRLLFQ
jgi:SulP family sulfate permease